MWTRTYTHPTTANPARLWAVLSDVDGWVSWNDGIEAITLHGPLAVGSTFEMTPPGEQPLTSTVIEVEPPHLITDLTEVDGISIKVEHRLDPGPDGTTVIFYTITVTGDVPDAVAAEVGTAVSADFGDVMANLAAVAKGSR